MKTHMTSTQQGTFKVVGLLGLFIILFLMANPVNAQTNERTISGVVNSLDGPLYGATIILKGTVVGATSNEKGQFTFPKNLKEDDVLVVSYLGYESDEIIIDNETSFITPFLADIPVIIRGAIRVEDSAALDPEIKN